VEPAVNAVQVGRAVQGDDPESGVTASAAVMGVGATIISVLTRVVFALAELASLGCLVMLWRTPASVGRKTLWTLVVVVPVLGPLFYGGLFDVPSRQSDDLQAPRTAGDDAGPHGP
jgi:hypothetical protein